MNTSRANLDQTGLPHHPLMTAILAQDSAQIQAECAQVLGAFDPRQEHAFFSQVSRLSHEVAIELKGHENLSREADNVATGTPTALDRYDAYVAAVTAVCGERMGPDGLNASQAKVLADALASQRRHASEPTAAFRAHAKSLGEALGLTASVVPSNSTPNVRPDRRPR